MFFGMIMYNGNKISYSYFSEWECYVRLSTVFKNQYLTNATPLLKPYIYCDFNLLGTVKLISLYILSCTAINAQQLQHFKSIL